MLKIPQTACSLHPERSVLSVCFDQDCQYHGMFCYQCIKYHYQHLEKTFELKEFLTLISENINDLSFNMLPTTPAPTLKDIFKSKYECFNNSKLNLHRQKEAVVTAINRYVDLAIETAENKILAIQAKHPSSKDAHSIEELTSYQDKFFDLINLQTEELQDLLVYFSRFVSKDEDKIEIVPCLPSSSIPGESRTTSMMIIENELDSTAQSLRNSELVLAKLASILEHLPPDDRNMHSKLSKITPNNQPTLSGKNSTSNSSGGGGSSSVLANNNNNNSSISSSTTTSSTPISQQLLSSASATSTSATAAAAAASASAGLTTTAATAQQQQQNLRRQTGTANTQATSNGLPAFTQTSNLTSGGYTHTTFSSTHGRSNNNTNTNATSSDPFSQPTLNRQARSSNSNNTNSHNSTANENQANSNSSNNRNMNSGQTNLPFNNITNSSTLLNSRSVSRTPLGKDSFIDLKPQQSQEALLLASNPFLAPSSSNEPSFLQKFQQKMNEQSQQQQQQQHAKTHSDTDSDVNPNKHNHSNSSRTTTTTIASGTSDEQQHSNSNHSNPKTHGTTTTTGGAETKTQQPTSFESLLQHLAPSTAAVIGSNSNNTSFNSTTSTTNSANSNTSSHHNQSTNANNNNNHTNTQSTVSFPNSINNNSNNNNNSHHNLNGITFKNLTREPSNITTTTSQPSFPTSGNTRKGGKRSEILTEQRVGLRSVQHFCDALEVAYNDAWCVSFRVIRECSLSGLTHLPIYVYQSTVSQSLESASFLVSVWEGNGMFTKRLYEQTMILKRTTKEIANDETVLANVVETLHFNTLFKLRKNCEYTILFRNRTPEQQPEIQNHSQLYVLFGDDTADDVIESHECEGSKYISFQQTNTSNFATTFPESKLIVSNNDSIDNPILTDYFIPCLTITPLPQDQFHFKSNSTFHHINSHNNNSNSNNNSNNSNANVHHEVEQDKTPKRSEFDTNSSSISSNNNNNNTGQRGFKDFMNNFKNGFSTATPNAPSGSSGAQNSNSTASNENDFSVSNTSTTNPNSTTTTTTQNGMKYTRYTSLSGTTTCTNANSTSSNNSSSSNNTNSNSSTSNNTNSSNLNNIKRKFNASSTTSNGTNAQNSTNSSSSSSSSATSSTSSQQQQNSEKSANLPGANPQKKIKS